MAEEALIREIQQTKDSLAENIGALESQVRETVETAKTSVKETIDFVRSGIQAVNPKYQVQKHPLWVVGGSVVAGVLVASLFRRESAVRASPHFRSLLEPFREEFNTLKGVALSAAITGVAEAAKNTWPQYREQVEHVVHRFTDKLDSRFERLI